MTEILAPAGLQALRDTCASRPLLAFDFDGTLAPLVDDPAATRMRASTRRLLGLAARRFPVVVISGRSRADVAARLRRVPVAAVVGNHGAERSGLVEAGARARVRLWCDVLRVGLADLDGVEIEDKGLTLAVHYRRSARPAFARERILIACSGLPRARIFGGHAVVHAAPEHLPRKSDALREACARHGASHALFVGDDETDEEVFAAEIEGLLSVRVGKVGSSRASFYLRDQAEIDGLLREILRYPDVRAPRAAVSGSREEG